MSGEVQLQFSLVDSANPAASPEEIVRKFRSVIQADYEDDFGLSRQSTNTEEQELEDEDLDDDAESINEAESPGKQSVATKEKRRRMARLRRKSIAVRAYEFVGKDSDLSGIIFMEIGKITDLPPEKNSKSGF